MLENVLAERVQQPKRLFWKVSRSNDLTLADRGEIRDVVPEAEAHLVSSLCSNGNHAPALDIDFPARLVPSSTPGHFHLFLDREISWDAYVDLLNALAAAGIIQNGYARASIRRGATFLRTGKKSDEGPNHPLRQRGDGEYL